MNRWHAWHLHYHGDLTRMLAEHVGPLLTRWIEGREVDRFFFIRYELGGPHMRIRLRLGPGVSSEDLGRRLTDRTEEFFHRRPSRQSWSEARIRENDARLLASGEAVPDGTIQGETISDESIVPASYRPEVERYGGPDHLEPNHSFFALSSAVALRTLSGDFGSIAGRRPGRTRLLPLLLAQAIGGSVEPAEARSVVRYPPEEAWKIFAPIVRKAEAFFERESDAFAEMFSETVAHMSSQEYVEGKLGSGAGYLARLFEDPSTRRRVLRGQLHMTANRLGLSNAEEVYLSQIATRCLESFSAASTLPRDDVRPEEASRLLGRLFVSCFEIPARRIE